MRASLALVPLLLACTAEDAGYSPVALPAPDDRPMGLVLTALQGSPAAPYVVLAPEGLADAAATWADYRTSTGWDSQVVLVAEGPTEEDFPTQLHALLGDRAEFLLLLGDADEDGVDGLPTAPCENELGDCYTDNTWGDLDDDGVPDLAVGRIPFNDEERILAYLDKVDAYSTERTPGPWDRRLSIYAGAPGFGATQDAAIEVAVTEAIGAVHPAYDVLGAYDEPTSDYYYSPFEDKVIDLYNDGAVAAVYIGHGNSAYAEGLPSDRIDEIEAQGRMPLGAFFACYNGNFGGTSDSLAELLLQVEKGPIATFGSVDVSDVYGNTVLPYELQRAMFEEGAATVGQAIALAKSEAVHNDDDFRSMASTYAILFGYDEDNQARQIQQHNNLYNLLGDPAVPLYLPVDDVELVVAEGSFDEGWLVLSGTTDTVAEGEVWVTLEIERTRFLHELSEPVDEAAIQSNWALAMDKIVTEVTVEVVDGTFESELFFETEGLPHADYLVKALATSEDASALGALQVE